VVAAQVAELRLEERFCGPPASANGGYACGAIAELLGGALVHHGYEFVAEAPPATVGLALPATASPTEAPRHRPWWRIR
jgi:hypothetical protein